MRGGGELIFIFISPGKHVVELITIKLILFFEK